MEQILPYSLEQIKLIDNDTIVVDNRRIKLRGRITLDWVNGCCSYSSNLIKYVANNSLLLPTAYWKYVTFDVDKYGVLYYAYRMPIPVDGLPGYYHIPYYNRYAITRDGDILRLDTRTIKPWCTSKYSAKKNIKGGYKTTRCLADNKNRSVIQRHRAIALTFLRYYDNPTLLNVNHIDGTPGNDSIDNIEWVTPAYNNQHAIDTGLTPNSLHPVTVYNILNNTNIDYPSIVKCSSAIGISENVVRGRLRRCNMLHPDGVCIVDKDTCLSLVDVMYKFNVYDYNSKLTKVFDTIHDASEYTQVDQVVVARTLLMNSREVYGGFMFFRKI